MDRGGGQAAAAQQALGRQQGGQTRPLAPGLLGYVLPGAVMRWPVTDPLTMDSTLQLRVNGAPQVQSVSPAQ